MRAIVCSGANPASSCPKYYAQFQHNKQWRRVQLGGSSCCYGTHPPTSFSPWYLRMQTKAPIHLSLNRQPRTLQHHHQQQQHNHHQQQLSMNTSVPDPASNARVDEWGDHSVVQMSTRWPCTRGIRSFVLALSSGLVCTAVDTAPTFEYTVAAAAWSALRIATRWRFDTCVCAVRAGRRAFNARPNRTDRAYSEPSNVN